MSWNIEIGSVVKYFERSDPNGELHTYHIETQQELDHCNKEIKEGYFEVFSIK